MEIVPGLSLAHMSNSESYQLAYFVSDHQLNLGFDFDNLLVLDNGTKIGGLVLSNNGTKQE